MLSTKWPLNRGKEEEEEEEKKTQIDCLHRYLSLLFIAKQKKKKKLQTSANYSSGLLIVCQIFKMFSNIFTHNLSVVNTRAECIKLAKMDYEL